ncbi:MAG: hypothetical protein ACFB5Z_11195, partial [Elainellaceae cyanobacterium]
ITTYYVQNAAIDNLVDDYGPRLEGMTIAEKLMMITVLSRAMHALHEFGISNGVAIELDISDYGSAVNGTDYELIEQHLLAIEEECTEIEALRLIEALTAQLIPALGKSHGRA